MFWNKKKIIVNISGMSCDKCRSHVKDALESIPEVDRAKVNNDQATIFYKTAFNEDDIRRKIEELGYSITGIKKIN